ncbi:ABC transporter permease [Arthrobacter crystallopoietes]|uniref:Putative ABC transport system permease protein n=1 Tax=Crystallibacter crystallopoietes TaxID=37928 RepID=A0A1H1A5F9_9MICC|nr:ABC transporter permease [Arthrobacter crystallopoietes]AUI51670.1 cell division protein FtsX [Arthrobacter crystallopoietes]SDQ34840.1 putative ABC transport system permease protein [Arthrobacter crystallopoietes]
MTGLIAALVEAWAELRIHKTRVLLALIGVALSVAALTTVVGLGNMSRAAMVQTQEQQGGRAATVTAEVFPASGEMDVPQVREALEGLVERYGVEHSSLRYQTSVPFQFPDGVSTTETMVVDRGYGTMRRVDLSLGHWFTPTDEQRLAPAIIVNEAFHQRLGLPDLQQNPAVQIVRERPITATVVGVVPNQWPEAPPQAMLLAAHYDAWALGGEALMPPAMEMWVPEEIAEPLAAAMSSDLAAQFGPGSAQVFRSDYAAFGDPFESIQLAVGGIAGLVLLLGAVGLLNISMVTVRYRVREVGIRRSFGATGGRIFFGVMLESVVATFVAGVIGVMLAVAVVKSPWVQELIAAGVSELPPFPLEAALIGLGAATLVGALAGLIPAVVAVRVKVIDAIRY